MPFFAVFGHLFGFSLLFCLCFLFTLWLFSSSAGSLWKWGTAQQRCAWCSVVVWHQVTLPVALSFSNVHGFSVAKFLHLLNVSVTIYLIGWLQVPNRIHFGNWLIQFQSHSSSIRFSCSVMSKSLRPHGLQHARFSCSSPTLGAYSNSCLSSQWCHPTISPLLVPSPPVFSLAQHQGLFKWVSSLHQVAKVLEFQLQHQSFQWIFRTDFH